MLSRLPVILAGVLPTFIAIAYGGGFESSCDTSSWYLTPSDGGTFMSIQCLNFDGDYQWSWIDLAECMGNNNGKLVSPGANYDITCFPCGTGLVCSDCGTTESGTIFSCGCTSESGSTVVTDIDLSMSKAHCDLRWLPFSHLLTCRNLLQTASSPTTMA